MQAAFAVPVHLSCVRGRLAAGGASTSELLRKKNCTKCAKNFKIVLTNGEKGGILTFVVKSTALIYNLS